MTKEVWPFPTGNKPDKDEFGEGSAFNSWNKAISYIVEEEKRVYGDSSDEEDLVFPEITETDPNGLSLNSPGAKADAGKNRVWLFMSGFSNALEEVSKVTTIGANKYTPNGWVDVPNGIARYMDAFGRHMLKLGAGNVMDDDVNGTGCYHKAQMIWNLLASLELELREVKND